MKLKPVHYIVLVFSLFTALWWWIGDLIDAESMYNLFFFRPEKAQKLHWYLHLSSFHVSTICVLWVLIDTMKKTMVRSHLIMLKILLAFEVWRLFEYWGWRYETPILVLSLAVYLSLTYLYIRGL